LKPGEKKRAKSMLARKRDRKKRRHQQETADQAIGLQGS
jgi:hypothetical protein